MGLCPNRLKLDTKKSWWLYVFKLLPALNALVFMTTSSSDYNLRAWHWGIVKVMVHWMSNQGEWRGLRKVQFQYRDEVQESKIWNTYMTSIISEINQTRNFSFKSRSRPEYKIDRIIGVGKLITGSCKASIIKCSFSWNKCVIFNLDFESFWEKLDRQCADHIEK